PPAKGGPVSPPPRPAAGSSCWRFRRAWPAEPSGRREVHRPIAGRPGVSSVSIRREAIEQAGAASRYQGGRVAGTRRMRGVPRFRRLVIAQAPAVSVAEHGIAFAALGPVAAVMSLSGGEGGAVCLGASQKNVVLVDGV